jgi:hypothetical protein
MRPKIKSIIPFIIKLAKLNMLFRNAYTNNETKK